MAEARTEKLLADAATRGERAISVLRGAFCLAILARFVLIGGLAEKGAVIEVTAISFAVAVSLFLLVRSRRRHALSRLELSLSVAVDAAVCFAALVPDVLWPWPGYEGLLATPDIAALLVVTAAAGFRLFPSVIALGGSLQAASFATLAALDLAISGDHILYAARNISIFAIVLSATIALAVVNGRRTLRLARAAAEQALGVARARQAFAELLREHHDVRSFLSSATLSSDVMLRSLAGEAQSPAELADLAAALRADLLETRRLVNDVKDRAYVELVTLEGAVEADVGVALTRVTAAVSRRFPGVRLSTAEVERGVAPRVAGGSLALERILLNLLVNACEGDGSTAARRVDVAVQARGDRVHIEVCDDGPGFDPASLSQPVGERATTKADGSGLGLLLTTGLVEASGGRLVRDNRPEGGARVVVDLPRGAASVSGVTVPGGTARS